MTATRASAARREVDDLIRGVCGGMLFGIPLLYTMEVWWTGGTTSPPRLLAVLVVAFAPLVMLIHVSGFRKTEDVRMADPFIGAVQALGVGLATVAVLLFLLGEIGPGTPLAETVGKIVYEAVPFAIGVAVARHLFARARDEGDTTASRDKNVDGSKGTLADLGATLIGSVFVAFNIAPTEEVPLLASAATPASLIAVIVASLVIGYAVVFEAGFSDQQKRRHQAGVLQHPVTETVAAYLVGLLAAAVMLWFFDNLSVARWQNALSQIVVLGLPAGVGGAAGRLAV